jgi:hypothetical protein
MNPEYNMWRWFLERPRAPGAMGAVKEFVKYNTIVLATVARLSRRSSGSTTVSPLGGLGQSRARWTVDDSLYAAYGAEGERRMIAHMDSLQAFLAARRIGMTVAVYPWPDQIAAGDLDSRQVRLWRDWSFERGVGFINHFPYFVRGTTSEERMAVINRYYIAGDVHWNELGHRVIADEFLDEFDHRRLLIAGNDNPSLP